MTMLSEDYDVLREMSEELRREAEETEREIRSNIKYIRDMEVHIKAFEKSEQDEFSVFYPGKTRSADYGKSEELHAEKSVREKRNEELMRRKEILQGRVRRLEDILSRQDFKSEKIIFSHELNKLADRMSAARGLMGRNPLQAAQELLIVERNIRKTAERINDGR